MNEKIKWDCVEIWFQRESGRSDGPVCADENRAAAKALAEYREIGSMDGAWLVDFDDFPDGGAEDEGPAVDEIDWAGFDARLIELGLV